MYRVPPWRNGCGVGARLADPSLVSAWSRHRLEDVGVGAVPAGRAEEVALEVSKALLNLDEIPAPGANPTPVADRATPG